MANELQTHRSGNAVLFYVASLIVLLGAAGGVFYLIPGIYHPFTSDTATVSYAHVKHALAFTAVAILGLVIARVVRPTAR